MTTRLQKKNWQKELHKVKFYFKSSFSSVRKCCYDRRKCAAGQSTVTEKNLATLDTNLSHSVLNNRLPNNTQITTNNISGLLCRSRPLRFIEDQLSLKNRTVKNNHRIHQGKLNGVLDTYSTRDTRRPGKNRYKSPPRDGKKNRGNLGRDQAKKFHDLPTK